MEILNENTLQKMISAKEEIVMIDVRTEEEVAEGKIADATNVDIYNPDFVDIMGEYDRSKTYVMICRSGARSGQACMHMMDLGFEKIYNLEGGMMGWTGETV